MLFILKVRFFSGSHIFFASPVTFPSAIISSDSSIMIQDGDRLNGCIYCPEAVSQLCKQGFLDNPMLIC